MDQMMEPIVAEIEHEADITAHVLDSVPADNLAWKPHKKSMSLGQLALHVASIPGDIAQLLELDELDVTQVDFTAADAESMSQVLDKLEESTRTAMEIYGGYDDAKALSVWRLVKGDDEIAVSPRIGFVRSLGLNHWYHHRGQLTVYLRLLDVPVPVTYGASADENPFA